MSKLQQIKNSLDLSKSSYVINKNIFRAVLFSIAVLCVAIFLTDGFQAFTGMNFACCPENANSGVCENSAYNTCFDDSDACSIQYFEAGTCIGDVPSYLTQNFSSIVIFLIIGSFLLNHLIFNRKYKFGGDKK